MAELTFICVIYICAFPLLMENLERIVRAIPRIDLGRIKLLEQYVTTVPRADPPKTQIVLDHHLKGGSKFFRLGTTRFRMRPPFIVCEFNPFNHLVDEHKSHLLYEPQYFEELARFVNVKNANFALHDFTYIIPDRFPLSNDNRPEAMIKGHKGRFDVVANYQAMMFIKDVYIHAMEYNYLRMKTRDASLASLLSEIGLHQRLAGNGMFVLEIPFADYFSKSREYALKKGLIAET